MFNSESVVLPPGRLLLWAQWPASLTPSSPPLPSSCPPYAHIGGLDDQTTSFFRQKEKGEPFKGKSSSKRKRAGSEPG